MSKKIAIIIGVVVLVIAAGVIYMVTKKDVADTGNTPAIADLDTSETDTSEETLRACDVVSKEVVETALAVPVQEPKTSGVTNIGVKGETCYYAFEENGQVTNSFYVDIEEFEDEAEANDTQSVSGMSGGVDLPVEYGSYAKYLASDSPYNGNMEYIMYLQNGNRVTKLIIAQPEGKVTFTDTTARAALDQIVQQAKLTF